MAKKSKKNNKIKMVDNIKTQNSNKYKDIVDTKAIIDNAIDDITKDNSVINLFDSISNQNVPEYTTNIKEGNGNNIFNLNTFNELYNVIDKNVDKELISISQSIDSAEPDKKSLYISGDIEIKRPNIVLVPLENNKVRIKVFNGPTYIYDEKYSSVDTDLQIGLCSIISSFINNGNGYGILFKDNKVIL